ncbi:hypothetical protein BKA69DRAFT_1101959 [Paraphysoderma sedebokerense]|nr:hypothetical protein BKA69DRAFT_1101959 [Paraphysoderma sedebokerense]
MKCKFCKKDCSASIDKNSIKSYKDSGRYAPIATIEGRGIDIVGWEPREGLVLKSSVSEAEWKDVGLDDDWAEYDDNGGEPVGVSEIETKVERTK